MLAPPKQTLQNDRFIKYGKYFVLLFALFLIVSASFIISQNHKIKNRDLVLSGTLQLITEETHLTKIAILYTQNNKVDISELNRHSTIITQLLHDINAQPNIPINLRTALNTLTLTIKELENLIRKIDPIAIQIQQSHSQFPQALMQCQANLNAPNEKRKFNHLLTAKLLYESSPSIKTQQTLDQSLKAFENIAPCAPLINSLQNLQQSHQEAQKLYQQIIELPLKQNILSIHQFYLTDSHLDIHYNQVFTTLLILVSFLFLSFISFTLYRLFKANKNLMGALDDLNLQKDIYHALSEANQAVVTLENKSEIYHAITNIIVRYIHIPSCWVAEKQQDSDWMQPAAMSGVAQDVIKRIKVSTSPDIPEGNGSIGLAFRSRKAVVVNDYNHKAILDPWSQDTKNWGLNAVASFPIILENHVEAVIILYSLEKNFFNEKIVKVIQELVDDIGLALERLQLRAKQKQLQESQAISAIAFESQESIIITDAARSILKTNLAFTEMTGYVESEVIGRSPNLLRSHHQSTDFYENTWKIASDTGHWRGEVWSQKKDGTNYQVYQTITAVFNERRQITHYILHRIDITETKKAESEISYLKNHDELTGLSNRFHLKQKVEQFLAKEQQDTLVFNSILIIINIKRFKVLNETLGHDVGDEALIETANRLKNIHLPDTLNTTISRIGSDEFALLCQLNNHPSAALNLQVSQILNAVNHHFDLPYTLGHEQVTLQMTLGVTLFNPTTQNTPEEIIQQALTALSRAKTNELGNFEFYQTEMQQQAIQARQLESALKQALDNEEFVLHYQPQINLKTGQVTGAEVLIRWQKQDGALIPPMDFIPTLESTSLIVPVGQWLIEKALTDIQPYQTQFKHPLLIAINLSAVQFKDPCLADFIEATVHKTHYPAHCLELEVTESILMENHAKVIQILESLSEKGIKIAIDDFGTGYSSLAYIKHFPVNKLKIDKSFIDDIEKPKDYAIVRSIIEMANAMSIHSIAEGVETVNQKHLLEGLNCQEVQGYFYSPPLPFEDFIAFAIEQNQISTTAPFLE